MLSNGKVGSRSARSAEVVRRELGLSVTVRADEVAGVTGSAISLGRVGRDVFVHVRHRGTTSVRVVRTTLGVEAVVRGRYIGVSAVGRSSGSDSGAVTASLDHVIRVGPVRAVLVKGVLSSESEGTTRANDRGAGRAINVIVVVVPVLFVVTERSDIIVINLGPRGLGRV